MHRGGMFAQGSRSIRRIIGPLMAMTSVQRAAKR